MQWNWTDDIESINNVGKSERWKNQHTSVPGIKPSASRGPCSQGWELSVLTTHHPPHPNLQAVEAKVTVFHQCH